MTVFELQGLIAGLDWDVLVVMMDEDGLDYRVLDRVRFVDTAPSDPYPFPRLELWPS